MAATAAGRYFLWVQNGDDDGGRVDAGRITVNGVTVAGDRELQGPRELFVKAVHLQAGANSLSVTLDGDPGSFLNWLRRMLHVRRQHPLFGLGGFELLEVSTPSVFAYLRTPPAGDEMSNPVLCVNNFSSAAQPAELFLSHLDGRVPVELLGGVQFPAIGELPYFVTLPPYEFLWFELTEPTG